MTTFNRISDGVAASLDALAEGWQELWNKAGHAITRFTPSSDDKSTGNNRWGLLNAELHEGANSITIELEAPGLQKQDFEIFVSGQTLVVRGSKQSSRQRSDGHYHITERAYGRFERLLPLPTEVDEEHTKANYRNGVLTIELPKSQKATPRVIAIK